MKYCLLIASAITRSVATCNGTATLVKEGMNHGGANIAHFPSESVNDCKERCCANMDCGAFTWTSHQPEESGVCAQGGACCWLKRSKQAAFSEKENCTSGEMVHNSQLMSPRFSKVSILANDTTGNLRDPSGMVQDPKTGKWHFWVVYIPGHTKPGWHGYLHHYSSDAIEGPFTNNGLALNHSTDPEAFDYAGMFSPSALYDDDEDLWFLFYSGIGANNTGSPISAQLVASAASPEGPWTRLGLVTFPTGSDETGWDQPWNARRCDSGRAIKVDGKRGYYTKGCPSNGNCAEGAYFPKNSESWKPPYAEWDGNPIYRADDGKHDYVDKKGYENCEFFLGPKEEVGAGKRLMHVLCRGHSGGNPHFIVNPGTSALSWQFVEMVTTKPASEPTPVYHSPMPGDEAEVSHFIARVEGHHLTVGLFKLDWVPITGLELPIVV